MVDAVVSKARTDQERVKQKKYRCSISLKLANQLGKDSKDHVRVETEELNAYFVVEQIHEDGSSDFRTKKKGRDRINVSPGDRVEVKPVVPLDDRAEAFPRGDIAETLWELSGSQVFISCPHGGDIEYNTDEMGMHLFKRLLGKGIPSTFWGLHGYYSSREKDAFERWHVKKPVKAYNAYPGLEKLVEEEAVFKYGVGFHIHGAGHVAVGGMADQDLRELVADRIRGPVPSKYDVVTDYEEMKWTGKGTSMSMNHFAENYQGVQIELPKRVAYNKFHSLPEAVSEVFAELL
ncbi:hypothetical protein HTG_17615 [Natrinema mahii]|nr:hypothetical protein HTG_17615 [Natrinema mahii]